MFWEFDYFGYISIKNNFVFNIGIKGGRFDLLLENLIFFLIFVEVIVFKSEVFLYGYEMFMLRL